MLQLLFVTPQKRNAETDRSGGGPEVKEKKKRTGAECGGEKKSIFGYSTSHVPIFGCSSSPLHLQLPK